MKNIPTENASEIKQMIISNILATDMKVHFKMLSDFKEKLEDLNDFWSVEPYDPKEKKMVLDIFIHISDLSGSCKTNEVSSRWSHLVNKEFIEQSKLEMQLGLPVTAHFKDLDVPEIFFKSEVSFLKFIVIPLYEVGNAFLEGEMSNILGHIEDSKSIYQKKYDEIFEKKNTLKV